MPVVASLWEVSGLFGCRHNSGFEKKKDILLSWVQNCWIYRKNFVCLCNMISKTVSGCFMFSLKITVKFYIPVHSPSFALRRVTKQCGDMICSGFPINKVRFYLFSLFPEVCRPPWWTQLQYRKIWFPNEVEEIGNEYILPSKPFSQYLSTK